MNLRPDRFQLFFAYSRGGPGLKTFIGWNWQQLPLNVLVAFPFISKLDPSFQEKPAQMMLDSGAYSAWNSGKVIDIDQLISETKKTIWQESICLDVIGNAEESLKNALYMKENESPAFPVFHIGDPWEILREYCQQFDRVGLSCRFGESTKESMRWAGQCFAREWPHRFHSFGWVAEEALMSYPFATADTASWERGPAAFGWWKAFGGQLPAGALRGGRNLGAEVQWYLSLENRVQGRWNKVLREIQ